VSSFVRCGAFCCCDRACSYSLTSLLDHILLLSYINYQDATYDANSYYEEYIANNNGYQQASNENYSYGSQYYGNGYWDNANNNANANANNNNNNQNYQNYQQQQAKQNTNYAMGYQVRAGVELSDQWFPLLATFLVESSFLV